MLNLTHDLDSLDGLETVQLFPAGASSGDATAAVVPVTVPGALRRGLSRSEREASGGRYLAGDLRWHLSALAVGTTAVLPGARIVDASGEAWTVLEVAPSTLNSRLACVARNLAIVGGLDQRVTLERARWERDAHGAPVAVWSVTHTGVRARVQPIEADVTLDRDALHTRTRFRVYFAEPLALDGDVRIVHGDRRLRVLNFQKPDRLDELLVVEAEGGGSSG